MYGFLADLMVAIHVAYVLYVVIGQLLILIGWWRGWQWVRNPWFRITHLIAIGLVVLVEFLNLDCPLTVWERQFRELAGQPFSGETILARFLHALIFYDFPPWVLTSIHLVFGLLVLITFLCCPPRWSRDTIKLYQSPG
jgi:hypothetical protein